MKLTLSALAFITKSGQYKREVIPSVPLEVEGMRMKLLTRFQIWEQRTCRLGLQGGRWESEDWPLSASERTALLTLLLHHCAVTSLLKDALRANNPSVLSSLDSCAPHMLKNVQQVLDDRARSRDGQPLGTSCRHYSLQIGVLAPLFLVALKASDLELVNQATELLRSCGSIREGMYDAKTIANVVEGLIRRKELCEPLNTADEEQMPQGIPSSALPKALEWVVEPLLVRPELRGSGEQMLGTCGDVDV